MAFFLILIWFKSNFERIAEENEVYELDAEIKVHFEEFLATFGKSYRDMEVY